jgi:hypothetical protein
MTLPPYSDLAKGRFYLFFIQLPVFFVADLYGVGRMYIVPHNFFYCLVEIGL